MFSQELLTNGELNHFSLKERMVEIGKRWHKLSAAQKDKYKKLVEEQQVEYKVELEAWLKVRPSSLVSDVEPEYKMCSNGADVLCSLLFSAVAVCAGPRRLQGALVLGEALHQARLASSALLLLSTLHRVSVRNAAAPPKFAAVLTSKFASRPRPRRRLPGPPRRRWAWPRGSWPTERR